MDFFSSQDAARRKTGRLVGLFCLAVILTVLAVYLVFSLIFLASGSGGVEADGVGALWDTEMLLVVASVTLVVVLTGSLYKMAALRGGGQVVAEMLGGHPVPGHTTDLRERQLLNVVEEMALASGVPVPPVYLLGHEQGINAFAAGFHPDDAVIGVTRGTVETLSRDELQGVIAHEFSHILNGDMRLNLRLMGILHGILLISIVGYWIMRSSAFSRGSDRKNNAPFVLFGLGLLIVGYIGVFFGNLIKSAVSRQREYLADASAVQFTRNPPGLAGALKKIGASTSGSKIGHPKAGEASHMYFGNGLGGSVLNLFSTHPPLAQRIRRIDPAFDGTFQEVGTAPAVPPKPPSPPPRAAAAGRPRARVLPDELAAPLLAAIAARPDDVLKAIGAPMREHLESVRALLDRLPDPVRHALREPFGARAVMYGLLLDRDQDVRNRQVECLRAHADHAVFDTVQELLPALLQIERAARLPLVDLAVAPLRRLSPAQYGTFRDMVRRLVEADDHIDLFEYALQHVLVRHLEAHFDQPRRAATKIHTVREVARECSVVLSLLARVGVDDEKEAETAFRRAASQFREPGAVFDFLPAAEAGLRQLDQALVRLALVSVKVKKWLVVACVQCLVQDQKITMEEAELFRAVADSLDCPIPPWLTGAV